MTITPHQWHTAQMIRSRCAAEGIEITGSLIMDGLQVSKAVAQCIMFGLDNEHILRCGNITNAGDNTSIEVILSDLHLPYSDDTAINAALDYIEPLHPDSITLLGDILDFYQLSKFTGRPDKPDTMSEISAARTWLQDLRRRFPKATIRYLAGNHEERLHKYICDKADKLYTLLHDLLPIKLDLAALDIEYHDQPFTVGNLLHIHGHECISGLGKQICDPVFNATYTNTILGHCHRTQSKIYKSALGKIYTVDAIGCLCQPMDYSRFDQWVRGFACVYYAMDGSFYTESHTILDGRVY